MLLKNVKRWWRIKYPPTDRAIFNSIYRFYATDFENYLTPSNLRPAKIFVPIDCERLANHIGVGEDIIFGRLYYHLNPKYRKQEEGKPPKELFVHAIGNRPNPSINFPMMAAILASMNEERYQFFLATALSIAALVISILSFLIN